MFIFKILLLLIKEFVVYVYLKGIFGLFILRFFYNSWSLVLSKIFFLSIY